jgi:phenylpropionate dioxygenase-like ring-hydroxylating dioxygenase large terminal subunit
MIPNQWYVVLESREVRPGRLLGVTRMGERLVFGRGSSGKAFCLRDRCAHRGAALSLGKVAGDAVECPFHGFRYDASGRGVLIPANGGNAAVPERFHVYSYPVSEKHGFLWIWWGDTPPADLAEPSFFDDLDPRMSRRTAVDPWDAHYSRAIENQLDVVHLPFVHASTIGRGGRTLVNGPVTLRKDPDTIVVHVFNEADRGQAPRKPEEIAPPYPEFHVEFRFPNLWENHIAPGLRVVIAFVPVDGEHSLLYVRNYQSFVRLPLLRGLFDRIMVAFDLRVAHQDRRVVVTQVPKASGVGAAEAGLRENLVQGDGPIAAYRMRREELIRAAARRD